MLIFTIAISFEIKAGKITKDKFVNTVLKEKLNAEKVFCGFNYTFGAGGTGKAEELKQLCKKQNISVEIHMLSVRIP